jgi:hypothetical protein
MEKAVMFIPKARHMRIPRGPPYVKPSTSIEQGLKASGRLLYA